MELVTHFASGEERRVNVVVQATLEEKVLLLHCELVGADNLCIRVSEREEDVAILAVES